MYFYQKITLDNLNEEILQQDCRYIKQLIKFSKNCESTITKEKEKLRKIFKFCFQSCYKKFQDLNTTLNVRSQFSRLEFKQIGNENLYFLKNWKIYIIDRQELRPEIQMENKKDVVTDQTNPIDQQFLDENNLDFLTDQTDPIDQQFLEELNLDFLTDQTDPIDQQFLDELNLDFLTVQTDPIYQEFLEELKLDFFQTDPIYQEFLVELNLVFSRHMLKQEESKLPKEKSYELFV